MNVQSYGYMQRSTDIIDMQNFPLANPSNTPQRNAETVINMYSQGLTSNAMGGPQDGRPPLNPLEKQVKLQRRPSGKMVRPLGLTQQRSSESIRLKRLSSGSDIFNNSQRTSSGNVNNRDGSNHQRSDLLSMPKLGIHGDQTTSPEIPQRNRVRRHVSLNSPRSANIATRTTSSSNIQALAIDNTPSQAHMSVRQNSDLQNPYKKLVPKPQLYKQLTQVGTNSSTNFTQSIEFFNVDSTAQAKDDEISALVSSKSIDPSLFTDPKNSQLVSQSAVVGVKNPENEVTRTNLHINSASSNQLQQSQFVKSMDTIRLSTITFEQTDSQFLSSQSTFIDQHVDTEQQGRQQLLSVGPKTLHRRGIANRDRLDTHPLPEQPDEVLSQFTRYTYNDDVSNYDAPAFSIPTAAVNSGRSSPSQTVESDTTQSWTETADGFILGNTTERSSEFSLEDTYSVSSTWDSTLSSRTQEFDRNTSLQVRKLFEEIDSMLFERNPDKSHHLHGECKEWVGQFPHMRLSGHQLLSPQDHGFVVIPGDESQANYYSGNLGLLDVTEQDISTGHTLNELTVSGQHVNAKHPSSHLFNTFDHDSDPTCFTEETFVEDGHIEDIIAVDFSSIDEDVKSNVTRRGRRQGLPPMTPQACIKDNLHGAVFDIVWTEVIAWLRPLNNRFVQNVISDTIVSAAEQIRNVHQSPFIRDDPLTIIEDEENASTPRQRTLFPLTLDPILATSPPREYFNHSREESNLSTSRGPDKNIKGVASGTLVVKTETKKSPELTGVLTVSSKELQSRERDSTDLLGTLVSRPLSSITKLQQGGVKPDYPTRHPSAQKLRSAANRLKPIDRAKTPSVDDDAKRLHNEVLKGHKISTPNDHPYGQLPPIAQLQRIGALPPISMERETSENNISVRPDRKKAMVVTSQRASSAVSHDKENRLTFREHSFKERSTVPVQLDNRPNTTHAFRSDSTTPYGMPVTNRQRSQTSMAQTPMGMAPFRTPYNPSSGLGNIPQGVQTGLGNVGGAGVLSSGIQITGNSISAHNEEHTELEDAEQYDDILQSTQWDYRRLVRSSSFLSRSYEGASSNNLNSQVRRQTRHHPLGNTAVR